MKARDVSSLVGDFMFVFSEPIANDHKSLAFHASICSFMLNNFLTFLTNFVVGNDVVAIVLPKTADSHDTNL